MKGLQPACDLRICSPDEQDAAVPRDLIHASARGGPAAPEACQDKAVANGHGPPPWCGVMTADVFASVTAAG